MNSLQFRVERIIIMLFYKVLNKVKLQYKTTDHHSIKTSRILHVFCYNYECLKC